MQDKYARTRLLLGETGMEKLATSRVAVFGLGGVGSYAVEALVRSGIGAIDLIDHDTVCESNINRQLYATEKTVGRQKVDVAAERIKEIDPHIKVRKYPIFYLPETADRFDFSEYDYVVDAIDTLTGKLALAARAADAGVPIISSMGAGNKLDPTAFEVADIFETSVCPLARVMRRELRRLGITKLKVVYSKEPPRTPEGALPEPDSAQSRPIPGSVSFVPSVAGLIVAGEVIRDLTGV